ncbi:thioredoxin family protein [Haloactinopolyspora alba]|uniref:thioredoxin family protein n=1 Tax=Haloactinopolyspora alba TaxID=648780 RepID=UPI000D0DA764|nr:thioredoxin family protein [Haloactinopolyspora alba]
MTGLLVVVLVLVAATVFGVWWRRRDGRVRNLDGGSEDDVDVLSPDDIGHEFGSRATLVQFSTAFCQPCRATRATLAHVASSTDGVVHVEIDAEANLDLVRRLSVLRTPTTLVLDDGGRVVVRASGAPALRDVRAALPD